MKLTVVPLGYAQAATFVDRFHRHHDRPRGYKFAIGCIDESGNLRGVAMVGRPIARAFDNGFTVEITRTCTDGCQNANSFLYGACWRVAREMGYRRAVTYTQKGESGTSLRAAGWKIVAERPARKSWAEHTGAGWLAIYPRDQIGSGGVQRTLWETVL